MQKLAMVSFGSLKQTIFDKEARKQQYKDHIGGLNAYDRHKKFLYDYAVSYGKQVSAREKMPVNTDQDTLREGYRFIRTEEDDLNPSWEQRLVKRYYDKLFKDYEAFSQVEEVGKYYEQYGRQHEFWTHIRSSSRIIQRSNEVNYGNFMQGLIDISRNAFPGNKADIAPKKEGLAILV